MVKRVSAVLGNDDLNRVIHRESRGKPSAKASTSSATGLFQFIEQTWFETIYKHGPLELAKRIKFTAGRSKPYSVPDGGGRAILDMRKAGRNKALLKLNIDLGARLTEDNIKTLGDGWDIGTVYLAHFAGAGTARKALRADGSLPASKAFTAAQISSNHPVFYWKNGTLKTIAEVRKWATTVMKEWDRDGKPDYIGQFYPDDEPLLPLPKPKEAFEDRPPVKVEHDDGTGDEPADDMPEVNTDVPAAPHEPDPEPDPVPAEGPPPPLPPGVTISGDPATWWIQYRLKGMNYDPGRLDGKPGGKTFAAVTGFVTDWPEMYGDITPPKSTPDFMSIRQQLRREMDAAEAQRFVRPVTPERKAADPQIVKEVAPETVQQKRGIIATAWSAIVTTAAGIFTSFSNSVAKAWNWISGAKDQLPDAVTDTGTLSWIFGKLHAIPPAVWLFLGAGVLAFVCFGLVRTLKHTVDDVRTGKR